MQFTVLQSHPEECHLFACFV